MGSTKRICMWSGPRNISTTLMYSFAQRSDTSVYDEPLYAHYLANTKAKEFHPGAKEVLENQKQNGEEVIRDMLHNEQTTIQFYKHMTHHLLQLNKDFLKETENILLTRDPLEMLPSYAAVIDAPSIEDVGYKAHVELVDYFKRKDIPFTVIDAKRVLLNPREQLTKLCERLGIAFQESMLQWEKGARPEDGVWAKYWYKNIHNSTGFMPYKTKTTPFPEHLKPLLNECLPHYRQLLQLAL